MTNAKVYQGFRKKVEEHWCRIFRY